MTLPSKPRRERRERRRTLMLITARLLGIPDLRRFSRNAPRVRDLTDLQELINNYMLKKTP